MSSPIYTALVTIALPVLLGPVLLLPVYTLSMRYKRKIEVRHVQAATYEFTFRAYPQMPAYR